MDSDGVDSNSKVVSLTNTVEPLVVKETMDPGAAQNGGYDVLWADKQGIANGGASGGMKKTETTIGDPIKKSLAEVREEIEMTRGAEAPSMRKNSSSGHSSKKKGTSSKKSTRKNVTGTYNLSQAQANGFEMPVDDVPRRGDSQKRLPDLPRVKRRECCCCIVASRCLIVAILMVVILLVAAAIIAAIILLTANGQACDTFEVFQDKFAFGGQLHEEANTTDACGSICLKSSSCGGFDFERLTKKCFTLTGAVGEDFLFPARTTDHYRRRSVCNKTGKQITCTMVRTVLGLADGGTDIGKMSEDECKLKCLEERGCLAIDYNTGTQKCYIHTINDEAKPNPCCNHYSKSCQRCNYTYEKNVYVLKVQRINHMQTATQCGSFCDQRRDCAGFDFQPKPKLCDVITNPNYATASKQHVENYRKGTCKDVNAPP